MLHRLSAVHYIRIRHRASNDRLLKQPIEQEAARARGAAIEAEHEFIQIGVQLLGLNRAVMRAENPAFDQ